MSIKISDLPTATTFSGTDLAPIVQGGETKRIAANASWTVGNLAYTGTLTGGTGVVNLGSGQVVKDASGNVGIGTSSPDAKLDIVTSTNNGLKISDGTQAGIMFPSGLGGVASGTVTNHPYILISNNTEKMRIDTSGNVGIGTTSPATKLNVVGGRTTLSANNEPFALQLNYGSTQDGPFLGSPSADAFVISTSGGTERMRIDSSGRVGIGTAGPNYKLEINNGALGTTSGDSLSALQLFCTSSNNDSLDFKKIRTSNGDSWENAGWRIQQRIDATDMGYIQLNGSGNNQGVSFGTGATETMRITSSGNVGIGTTTPSEKLQVSGNISQTGGGYLLQTNGTNTVFWQLNPFGISNSFGIGTGQSIPFIVGNNNTERMRIDSSGNVGIGTTSKISDSFNGGAAVHGDALASGAVFEIKNKGNPLSGRDLIRFYNNSNGEAGSIEHTSSTSVSYLTSSDYRLKENIQPLTGALDKVQAMNPVTYDWKAGGHSEGFIAHELQEIAPYAVSGEKDGEDMQGVDYGKLTTLLVGAVKELTAKVEQLEAQLGANNAD